MVEKLSKKQITEFREAFAVFDVDGDGVISSEELRNVMKVLGLDPSDEDLSDMIKDVDTDGNGTVDFQEFVVMMTQKTPCCESDENLLKAFKKFDQDGNGFISADELRSVLKEIGEKLTEKDINKMITEADLDGDGQINFYEFTKMMTT